MNGNILPLALVVLAGCMEAPEAETLPEEGEGGHFCHYDPAEEAADSDAAGGEATDGGDPPAHTHAHGHGDDLDGDGNCGGGNNPDGDPDNPGKARKS